MSHEKSEADTLCLKSINQIYLSILSLVSKQFGVKFSDLKIAEFSVTLDDITNLHAQSDQLLENTSNKEARMKQFKIIENKNGALAQIYWKKYSSFMIDLIAAQAQSRMSTSPAEFNLKLGLARHLIGLFTEQIRNPALRTIEDITNITDEYLRHHNITPFNQQYETYGLFRQIGRRIGSDSLLFVQSSSDGYHELKEHIREDEGLWPSTLLPQLKDRIEQQQKHLKENYPYCFKVDEITFNSNIAKVEMHPDALKKIKTLLCDIFWSEQVTHVVVNVQSTGECYLEALAKHKTQSKIPGMIVDKETYHHYYFPNRFIIDNEGRGFYLGYVSDNDYCVEGSETTKKMIVCTHSSIHSEMDSIVHQKYIEVLNALETTDIKMFLKALFCYSYLYIKVMPYARGSAAITEWLMRGLAKAKGVDLGPFSKGISWDFGAFICISAEEYAKEYQQYFSDISVLPTNNRVLDPIVKPPHPVVEKIRPSSRFCC